MRRYKWAAVVPAIVCVGSLYRVSQSPAARALPLIDAALLFIAGWTFGLTIWGVIEATRGATSK